MYLSKPRSNVILEAKKTSSASLLSKLSKTREKMAK